MAKNQNKQEPQTGSTPQAESAETVPVVSTGDQEIIPGAEGDSATHVEGTETLPAVSANDQETVPGIEGDAGTPAVTIEQAFDGCFTCEGKKYRVRLPKVNIPGIGLRTALELAVDTEAQQWLIKNNCIGSIIEEVIE